MTLRHLRSGQEGSLPLTILAAIILAGVIAVLYGVVQSGIGSSGRDRDFASAIQVADAGLQEAYVLLGAVLVAEVEEHEDFVFEDVLVCEQPDWYDGPDDNSPEQGACIGDFGSESQFDWEYTCDFSEEACEVLAVGRHRTSARAVQVEIAMQTMTGSGIVGFDQAGWTGGGGSDPDDEAFWVGTFGCLTLPASNPGTIAGINYYGFNLAEDKANCWKPNYAQNVPVSTGPGPDFGNDPAARECATRGTMPNVPDKVVRGASYCVDRAHFPAGFEIINPDDADDHGINLDDLDFSADDDHVAIYVYNPDAGNTDDAVRVGGGSLAPDVNWSDAAGPGPAVDLQVFVSHNSGDVRIRPPKSRGSMLVWAPGSECRVNSNGEFHGVLTCYDVVLNGTYTFDSAAVDVTIVEPVIQRFTEERVPSERRDFAEAKASS